MTVQSLPFVSLRIPRNAPVASRLLPRAMIKTLMPICTKMASLPNEWLAICAFPRLRAPQALWLTRCASSMKGTILPRNSFCSTRYGILVLVQFSSISSLSCFSFLFLLLWFFADQKAWRKRQLCYRLTAIDSCFLAITDIIILSKTKKAPQGFTLAGEMNGLTICYKAAPLPAHRNQPAAPTRPPMPLPVSRPSLSPQPVLPSASPLPSRPSANSPTPLPRSVGQPPSQYPPRQANSNPTSPSGSTSAKNPPARPAPLPPTIAVRSPVKDSNVIKPTNGVLTVSYSTLSGHTGKQPPWT